MEKPKNIQEIVKLFEEKFPDIQFGANHEAIKQFWLEHTRALLESVRMEEANHTANCDCLESGPGDIRDCDCGYHYTNSIIKTVNQKIQFLLSEGGENN